MPGDTLTRDPLVSTPHIRHTWTLTRETQRRGTCGSGQGRPWTVTNVYIKDTKGVSERDTRPGRGYDVQPSQSGTGECAIPPPKPPGSLRVIQRKKRELPALHRRGRTLGGRGPVSPHWGRGKSGTSIAGGLGPPPPPTSRGSGLNHRGRSNGGEGVRGRPTPRPGSTPGGLRGRSTRGREKVAVQVAQLPTLPASLGPSRVLDVIE